MSQPIQLPQEQVDAIIRTKRKAREPKACYPCHTRKVKCDRQAPCDACVKRDHADLCTYERPSKKHQIALHSYHEQNAPLSNQAPQYQQLQQQQASAPQREPLDVGPRSARPSISEFPYEFNAPVSIPRQEYDDLRSKLRDMEQTISSLRHRLDANSPSSEALATPASHIKDDMMSDDNSTSTSTGMVGIHAQNDLGGGTVHLGSRSVMAYILGKSSSSQDAVSALLEENMLPKLGLDNESVSYPFVDLWSSNSSYDMRAVCAVMPDDSQCRE